ncbi:MAG: two-component regulator propeller domain-containing protein [Mucinivorans sp.]
MNRMSPIIRFILIATAVLWTGVAYSIQPSYYFKQISIPEGLTHPRVQAIFVDNKGIMWIGTQSGLNTFDHYTLKRYFRDTKPSGLPSSFIRAINQDNRGKIWISTSTGTVTYNNVSDNFSERLYNSKHIATFSSFVVPDGMLFGADGGLLKYSLASDSIEEMIVPDASQNAIGPIHDIKQLNEQTLVICSRSSGLWYYDLSTRHFTQSKFFTDHFVWKIQIDNRGQIWVSDYNEGVYCIDKDDHIIHHFTESSSELCGNIVLDILSHKDQVWFATDGDGISIYNQKDGTFSQISNEPTDRNSIMANSFYSLYEDRHGNIWTGSIREGLILIKPTDIQTYHYAPSGSTRGVSHETIVCLWPDPDGSLWIGTDGGGVNHYNPTTNRFTHYPSTAGQKIVSITSYSPKELLVSAFNKGLFVFNKQSGAVRELLIKNRKETSLHFSSGNLVNLYAAGGDHIYIMGTRMIRYDLHDQSFHNIKAPNIDAQQLTGLQVIGSLNGSLYLMSYQNILRLDEQKQTLSLIYAFGLEVTLMASVMDQSGNVWLGTDNGLLKLDAHTAKLEKIETNLFTDVTSLSIDSQGRLWGGGDNILFCYLIDENRFMIFGESDGVAPSRLIFTPFEQKDPDNIYMGSTKGLIKVNGRAIFNNHTVQAGDTLTPKPRISLLDAIADGRSVAGIYDDNSIARINLEYGYTSFSIKVIVDEKDIFRNKLFSFFVDGLSKTPVQTYEPTLALGQLSSGDYSIRVSCLMANGQWSQPTTVALINVTPPWWRQLWFVMLAMSVIIAGVYYTIHRVFSLKKRKMEIAMRKVEQRSYQDKINYLINISHELRTPLMLIIAPLKALIKSKTLTENQEQQVKKIYNNSQYMSSVINMVLDVQKMEAGKSPLCLTDHNIVQWIDQMIENFSFEAQSRGITLNFRSTLTDQILSFDEAKCKIVLSNLLINAFKFSPDRSTITIRVDQVENMMVRISVEDQGIGLDNVDQAKLFTPFYQGKHNRNGSGVGLSYAKVLVEQHKGHIGVKANADGGATFFYDLPSNLSIGTIAQTPTVNLDKITAPTDIKEVKLKLSLREYSVLVVDDDPSFLDFMRGALGSSFATLDCAGDGAQALEIIKTKKIDLVISDVMMPVVNGFELCGTIKSSIEISHIAVVLLTSQIETENREIGYKMGADAYIGKPFEIDSLLNIVSSILYNRLQVRNRSKDKLSQASQITFSSADEQFIDRLNDLIDENMSNEDLTIEFLASELCMSRTSLYNKVSQITSLGVNNYINHIRIDRAGELLIATGKTITEISEDTGFKYPRYFSTLFRQQMGLSPREWRKKHTKQE